MAKIGIVTRKNETQKWGGDLTALYSIYDGLKELGQDVHLGRSAKDLSDMDFVFLSNTCLDLEEDYQAVLKTDQRWGIIGFHEDTLRYYSTCYAFANFIALCLAKHSFFQLDQILSNPNTIDVFSYSPPPFRENNYSILSEAEFCISTSAEEAKTMLRDSPECKPHIVPLHCGIPHTDILENLPEFLSWTGLSRGEYILQVGRMEPRKNQLGSILATRDLDVPLVFIATRSSSESYLQICIEAIKRWRKAPTFIIHQTISESRSKTLSTLPMPNHEILSSKMLYSAYKNAALYLHPAFCELPGLTCLEAAKFGIPVVASQWSTLQEYFPLTSEDDPLNNQIAYILPHHILEISKAIEALLGKTTKPPLWHPTFQRTQADIAKDVLSAIYPGDNYVKTKN